MAEVSSLVAKKCRCRTVFELLGSISGSIDNNFGRTKPKVVEEQDRMLFIEAILSPVPRNKVPCGCRCPTPFLRCLVALPRTAVARLVSDNLRLFPGGYNCTRVFIDLPISSFVVAWLMVADSANSSVFYCL